jgi:hypothetical protein
LNLAHARTTVLVVHSEVAFRLKPVEFDEEAYEEAMELPIMKLGNVQEFENGRIKLYEHRGGYYGASFVVGN